LEHSLKLIALDDRQGHGAVRLNARRAGNSLKTLRERVKNHAKESNRGLNRFHQGASATIPSKLRHDVELQQVPRCPNAVMARKHNRKLRT